MLMLVALSTACYRSLHPIEFAPERTEAVAGCVDSILAVEGFALRPTPVKSLQWSGERRRESGDGMDVEWVGARIVAASPETKNRAVLHVSADGEAQSSTGFAPPDAPRVPRMRAEAVAWRVADCGSLPKPR